MTHSERARLVVAVPKGSTWGHVKARAQDLARQAEAKLISAKPVRLSPHSTAWPRLALASTTDVWLFEVSHAIRPNTVP